METKKCCRCHNNKGIDEFNRKSANKDGRERYCKECHRKKNRLHYAAQKGLYILRSIAARKAKRRWFWDFKSTLKCETCGTDKPWRLAFHHRDPSEKDLEVSRMISDSAPLKRIQEEIAKCDVLCHNCHADVHYANRGVV